MATAGLTFANPLLDKTNVGQSPDPYAPFTPSSGIGLGGLAPSAADMAVLGKQLTAQSQFSMPVMDTPKGLAYNQNTKEFFVQGNVFKDDDANAALQAEQLLAGPGTGNPTGDGWTPISEDAYKQYLDSIRNPTLGRLASKNFGRGVDSMQALGGRALQLAGFEETGANIVASQEADLAKTNPFERQFTDIDSGRGAVEWFVANLAQQGPNMLESVAVAGAGFLAGSAVGTPVAGAGAALAGLMGKSAFKQSVLAAAKKQAAGQTLNAAEGKLLREAAALTGAVVATYGQNLAMGAADIYGELREQGADASDMDARMKALAGAVPYAAMESLSEYLLASRVFGGAMAPKAMAPGASAVRTGGELLRRGVVGGAIGGTAEGATEAGQEALLLGISDQDLDSPEATKRLINAFAAGFGVGGPIGGAANLRSRQPANLLNPGQTSEPPTSLNPADLTTQGELSLEGGQGVAPVQPTEFPATQPNTQGVLDVGTAEQPMSPQEANLRGQLQQLQQPQQMQEPVQQQLFAPEQAAPQEPPLPPGMVRLYHGSATPGRYDGKAWFSTNRAYAENYRDGAELQYVDLPAEQVNKIADPEGYGQTVEQGFTVNLELDSAQTGLRKPVVQPPQVQQPAPVQTALQFAPESPSGVAFTDQQPPPATPTPMQQAMQRAQVVATQQQQQQVAEQQRQADLERLANIANAQRQVDFAAREEASGFAPTPARAVAASEPVQLPLFKRKEAPTPSRAQALRKGVGAKTQQQQLDLDAPAQQQQLSLLPEPQQIPLLGKEGAPTLPALRSAGLRKQRIPTIEQGATQLPPTGKAVTPATIKKARAAEEDKRSLKRGLKKQAGVLAPQETQPVKTEPIKAAENKPEPIKAKPVKVEQAQTKAVTDAPAKDITDDIADAAAAPDTKTFRKSVHPVVKEAFFTSEETNTKKTAEQARSFLSGTKFTDAQLLAMDEAFLESARSATQLEATYKSGARKGEPKPWFTFAQARNLLPRIKTKIVNVPTASKAATVVPTTSADTSMQTPQAMLGDLISDLVFRVRGATKLDAAFEFRGQTFESVVALATDLYARTDAQGKNYVVRGYKLKEFFTADGKPKTTKAAGRYVIAANAGVKDADSAAFDVEDSWDDPKGNYYRLDGTPAARMSPGKVSLIAKAFASKLRVKPQVSVFANVADLKKRDAKLYARAAAARKDGDFDTTQAVGYSFADQVIVFSDFARTEQQLKFVLAHETLGHFGLRSVVPPAQLSEVLNRVYDTDADVRASVDAKVQTQGMDKLEAIEEYVADNAADVDTSVLARVWSTLKNFLNKLGFTFEDDAARYLVTQARKYVRRGEKGHFVTVRGMASDFAAMAADDESGRYARVDGAGSLGSRVVAAGALNRRHDPVGGLVGTAEVFAKKLLGSRAGLPGALARAAEHVQTLDNKARRSYGLSLVYRVLEQQNQHARAFLSKYERLTATTHSPDLGFFGEGVSEKEKETAGELLSRAALLRASQATDEKIKSFAPLVRVDDAGFVTVDKTVRDKLEADGFVSADEFRKGFEVTYSDGSTAKFSYAVDEKSPEWQVYTELRKAVNESAVDLLLANYEAVQVQTENGIADLNKKRQSGNVFAAQDLAAIKKAAELYRNKRYEGSTVADEGVEVRAQAAKEAEAWLDDFAKLLQADPDVSKKLDALIPAKYSDLRAQLPALQKKVTSDDQAQAVLKAIRDVFLLDLQAKNSDYAAKRTILGAYVPFTRRGTQQVRLVAVDAKGNAVELQENVRSTLPYFQVETRQEALDIAAKLGTMFNPEDDFVLLDPTGNEVTVKFKTEVSRTRQSPDLTEAVSYNEFIYMLNRLNVSLAPQTRERIITTLTEQNSRARRTLRRSGTEGWDKDVVRSVSEHLQTTAHVASKKLYKHRLDDALLDSKNWLGDDQKLADLKAAVASATTDGDRARAQRAYDEYAYMYRYMKATGAGNEVTIDGKKVPTLGRGEDYREEAQRVLRWYGETTNIADSTEDFLSGDTGSALKTATVVMQLGGSVASAALNVVSMLTHSLPYLSFYNAKRGFGGGYGQAKSAAALWRAATAVKNANLGDTAALEKMIKDGSYARFGLTKDEATFLFEQTAQGTLQAAQFNALVGSAQGKVQNNKTRAAIKLWMSMFSYTEQFNRRTTALAAFRMEQDRMRAQGITDEAKILAQATEAARIAVNSAQGEYGMFNRPEMARGNVLQYVFMYKQFIIVTVQLLRSMPVQGQMMMLGFLLLASGLQGLPFAEDLFDIVDTIAQKLGLKTANIERSLYDWIDAVAPGAAPYVMRGGLNRLTGATISTRLGMGDLLPLTGAARAGADPWREVTNFAGPVFSGLAGIAGTASSFARYGAETVGLRDDVTTLQGILRDSPVSAVRAFTDAYTYLDNGAIVNTRGQTVSSEVNAQTIIARMLGFYPAIASEQSDIVRLSKYTADYAKAIKKEYVTAYVVAKNSGDTERAAQIVQDVSEWNEAAQGTGLEISSFIRSANRAAIEAARPGAARYLKSAPKQVKAETLELLRLNGLDEGDL